MTETKIQELIETAAAQLAFSYTPIPTSKSERPCSQKTAGSIRGATLRTRRIRPPTALNGQLSSRLSAKGVREFEAICIVGGPEGRIVDYTPPCGVCRQVMMEFCQPDEFQIILAKGKDDYQIYTLKDLMPQGFGPGNL